MPAISLVKVFEDTVMRPPRIGRRRQAKAGVSNCADDESEADDDEAFADRDPVHDRAQDADSADQRAV